ncbi:MAG: hypothetical protein HFG14_12935 [Lachnospiraceae bacterium]|jgi:hypothetical protein|nr:hypothetical protein [Lachnospiraceae bacterium]
MRIKGIKVQQGIKIKAVVLPRPGPPVSRPKPFVLARQESWKRASLYCAVSTRISLEFTAQTYPLPGKAHIHFVLHVPDGDHAVGGDPALQFQEEIRLKLSFREAAYLFRLGEETFLGGDALKGGMGGEVIAADIGVQAPGQGFRGREILHVKGGHPLVLHGPEPPLDLSLCCGGIGFAIMNGGADVPIRAAGIVDQGDHIYLSCRPKRRMQGCVRVWIGERLSLKRRCRQKRIYKDRM